MLQQLERVRNEENRTRSELTREALRQYIESRCPTAKATKAGAAAIRNGRAAIKRGDYRSLAELINEQELPTHKPANKDLKRFPREDQGRIHEAVLAMERNPFSGYIKRLQASSGWRGRVKVINFSRCPLSI